MPPSLLPLMSTTARSMHNTSLRPSPAPADTNRPTNENAIDADAMVTEELVMSNVHKNVSSTLEQVRNEIRPSNASEKRAVSNIEGGLPSKITSNTPDNGIKPNNMNESPAVSIEGSLANMANSLEQILDVLKGSTIAEERGKDDDSKFWATYKKVSTEYDDDFLGRANDDMGIILTFAGLFSAVNSTFIVGMQPNPGDTTNILLLYLIKMTVNGPNSVPDINTLSSSTGFPSSTVWMQALAYASLAFSVLAAFGAVLGKQWLNSYKSVRGRGSLEERGIERQMKLDGLEYFRLQTVLQAFLVLLQISLLLFGLSLSANMWAQQTTISSIIVCTTAFGILFYVGTALVSALRPDSPFQTPGSELFVAICQKFLPRKTIFTPYIFGKSSAIRWILETSTNPEIVEAAVAIVPCVQWPPSLDASVAFVRLRDTFMACHDKEELYVRCGKAMAHLCIQPVKINEQLLAFVWDDKFRSTRNRFIRDAFMAGRAAYDQLKNSQEEDARQRHRASARTIMRTIVVHGQYDRLSRPDDEVLIWNGDLRWRHGDGREPSCEESDWLVNYVVNTAKNNTDDETTGDALLALSAMHGLGSSATRWSYISALIRCMDSTRPFRVRHAALRVVYEAREELASITSVSMPPDIDAHALDELSRALLTAVRPKDGQPNYDTGPDASFHIGRDSCYIRIIYTLTKNDEWFQRLTRDGHDERCISLVDGDCYIRYWEVGFYLLVIFGRIKFSGKDLSFSPTQEKWRLLIANTWETLQYVTRPDSYIDGIPALVAATRLDLTASDGVPREWHAALATMVHEVLVNLQGRQAILVDDGIIHAALSSIQGLSKELSCMVKQRNTSRREDGALGLRDMQL